MWMDSRGEAFILTNPRLRDAPIVLVSAAFCAMTGYSRLQIVGRNCRFVTVQVHPRRQTLTTTSSDFSKEKLHLLQASTLSALLSQKGLVRLAFFL